jgi:hypothetical protein
MTESHRSALGVAALIDVHGHAGHDSQGLVYQALVVARVETHHTMLTLE